MFKQLTSHLVAGGVAAGTTVLTSMGALSRLRPEPLEIYLNDHLLGATFGTELASRIAAAHRSSAPALDRLATEIGEDRETLKELMDALGVPARRYKIVAGWVAEKAGRLKPNGRLLERSDLSDLEELEIMCLGVEGKAACWRTLRALADRDDRLEAARLDALMARARRQADALEELRIRSADHVVT